LIIQGSQVQLLLTYGPFGGSLLIKRCIKKTDSQDLKLKICELSHCVIEIVTH